MKLLDKPKKSILTKNFDQKNWKMTQLQTLILSQQNSAIDFQDHDYNLHMQIFILA